MNWKKSLFANFRLYAVTDLKTADPDILEKIDAAYRGGADIVQLRSKTLTDRELLSLAKKARALADRRRKLFFMNDRVDLALAAGADGVHLGQEDFPVEEALQLCRRAGAKLFIGKSTHSLEQARTAVCEKVDYIGVGPVFETPTKPGRAPVGLELVRQIHRKVKIPFVAIGGIDPTNIDRVLAAGADRIAVVRAVFAAADVCAATGKLRKKIDEHIQKTGT